MRSGMPIETVRPRERGVDAAAADPPSSSPGSTARGEVKPAQDEWGLFDPEQCGVAALLKKLKIVR
jgi:hypothetical protein